MVRVRTVVDNRVFLLGLDELYRVRMKSHERRELLECARLIAGKLDVRPANVPVEGYYAEEPELTEYFRLLRALQEQPNSRVAEVEHERAYERLYEVTSAPLFGRPRNEEKFLPVGRDALSEALFRTRPVWTIPTLTAAAHEAARGMDDFSLVGLAAIGQDPVVLAALRETVVLYAELMYAGCALGEPPDMEWRVDDELARQAARFITAFNALFPDGSPLPSPSAKNAEMYWSACDPKSIMGRCVRLGYDDGPTYYHWAIKWAEGALIVDDFWAPEIWTTARYRQERLGLVTRA